MSLELTQTRRNKIYLASFQFCSAVGQYPSNIPVNQMYEEY